MKSDPASLLTAAVADHRAGRLEGAERRYRAILKREPELFDALNLLGSLLCQRGKPQEGLAYLERAVRRNPRSASARRNAGVAQLALRRFEPAAESFSRARSLAPGDPAAIRGLTEALMGAGQHDEATEVLRAALKSSPNHPALLACLGSICIRRGLRDGAVAAFSRLVQVQPGDANAFSNLGCALADRGDLEPAIAALETGRTLAPNRRDILLNLAKVHRQAIHIAEALKLADEALAIWPEDAEFRVLRASVLGIEGRSAEAVADFRAALPSSKAAAEAVHGLFFIQDFADGSPEARRLDELLASDTLAPADRAMVHFAAGRRSETRGDFDRAFAHFTAAHRANPAPFDIDRQRARVDAWIAGFSQASFSTGARGSASEEPVFVVGMPRSGTSLVDQIVASHGEGGGAGELSLMRSLARELGFFDAAPDQFAKRVAAMPEPVAQQAAERYLAALRARARAKRRIVDKMPHNFEVLGLIARLFPNARIVHCTRDAVDTCVSCYTVNLNESHGYASDLGGLGRYHREYRRLMAHWSVALPNTIHEHKYERFVADPEAATRALIAFLGLDWDDACLRFHETDRAVGTFSRFQVRQPVFRSSVEKWRRYEHHLGPLIAALEGK